MKNLLRKSTISTVTCSLMDRRTTSNAARKDATRVSRHWRTWEFTWSWCTLLWTMISSVIYAASRSNQCETWAHISNCTNLRKTSNATFARKNLQLKVTWNLTKTCTMKSATSATCANSTTRENLISKDTLRGYIRLKTTHHHSSSLLTAPQHPIKHASQPIKLIFRDF